jgi:hypothetical protein
LLAELAVYRARTGLQSPHGLIGEAENDLLRTWARIVMQNGYAPTVNNLARSVLFRRMLSGRAPLVEPPPRAVGIGPMYSLIESSLPLAMRADPIQCVNRDDVITLWLHPYRILERRPNGATLLADGMRSTSWRFWLWFDPEHSLWVDRPGQGTWFVRSAQFGAPALG